MDWFLAVTIKTWIHSYCAFLVTLMPVSYGLELQFQMATTIIHIPYTDRHAWTNCCAAWTCVSLMVTES